MSVNTLVLLNTQVNTSQLSYQNLVSPSMLNFSFSGIEVYLIIYRLAKFYPSPDELRKVVMQRATLTR